MRITYIRRNTFQLKHIIICGNADRPSFALLEQEGTSRSRNYYLSLNSDIVTCLCDVRRQTLPAIHRPGHACDAPRKTSGETAPTAWPDASLRDTEPRSTREYSVPTIHCISHHRVHGETRHILFELQSLIMDLPRRKTVLLSINMASTAAIVVHADDSVSRACALCGSTSLP